MGIDNEEYEVLLPLKIVKDYDKKKEEVEEV